MVLDSTISQYHNFMAGTPQMFDPSQSNVDHKNSSVTMWIIIGPIGGFNYLLLCLASRLKDHVNDKTKLPILIFPEGECNHTASTPV